MRRRLKTWERNLLFRLSGGRCGICGTAITRLGGWHADHIEAFARTGRTNVYEMQALCAVCNLKKGTNSMSEAAKRLRAWNPDLSGFTEDQRKHYDAMMAAIRKGEREIGHYAHIRFGKSMLIRMSSISAVEEGLAPIGIVVNDRADLRMQIIDQKEWKSDLCRLKVTAPRPLEHLGYAHVKYDMDDNPLSGCWPDEPWPNNEYLLSTSIQTLCKNMNWVIEWTRSINHKFKLPVLVHLDEAQNYGIDETGFGTDADSEDWYPNIEKWRREADIILNTLSGYPHRQNGKLIFGFKPVGSETKKVERIALGKLIRIDPDGVPVRELVRITGSATEFSMEPVGGEQFVTPIARGFEVERLCPIELDPIVHKITLRVDSEVVLDNQSLADVDKDTARKVMREYLAHPEVVAVGVDKLVRHLEWKREVNSSIKALVYTQMDGNGRSNDAHANDVATALKARAPHLKVRILTNNSDDTSAEALLSFKTDDTDVLILKNRGRVGLDAPVAKVELDLSTVRAPGMAAQTWLRPTTPFDGVSATLIAPGDPITTELYTRIVTNNGGDPMRDATTNGEVIGEARVEPEKRTVEIGAQEEGTLIGMGKDGRVVTTDGGDRAIVDAYLKDVPGQAPMIRPLLTEAQIRFVQAAIDAGIWSPPDGIGRHQSQQKPRRTQGSYRKRIAKLADEAANRHMGVPSRYALGGDEQKEKMWNRFRADLLKAAKRNAGQPEDRAPADIQNLDALAAIEKFLET
jgi:hypothetical protein